MFLVRKVKYICIGTLHVRAKAQGKTANAVGAIGCFEACMMTSYLYLKIRAIFALFIGFQFINISVSKFFFLCT